MVSVPSLQQIERFRRDVEALAGAPPERLAVAVSGGPDSLALLLLAHAAYPGRIDAATVDHGLRTESAGEARLVADVCARLRVLHTTLLAEVDAGPASLQQSARRARYAALADWLAAEAIPWLATAHQLDDQAETLMMRLMRGSGAAGLAGIRARGPLPGGPGEAVLLRPLLSWRRAELRAVVEAAGITPADDPGNGDERFDRARIRRRLGETPWIDAEPLARSAEALAAADEALTWAAERAWAERVKPSGGGIGFDASGLPAEIVRRILHRIIEALGAGGRPPRGHEVERLAAALAAGKTATLGGIKCRGGGVWRFETAPPRRG